MTVTSLKDMESYIYSKVVLPLKELDVDSLNISSPMTDRNGRTLELLVSREEVTHIHYEHNFQRDEARQQALFLIWYKVGYTRGVLADYDPMKHTVNLYAPMFERLTNGKFLRNKLLQAFNNYTPFNRIEIKDAVRDGYRGGEHSRHTGSDDFSEEEDDSDDSDDSDDWY